MLRDAQRERNIFDDFWAFFVRAEQPVEGRAKGTAQEEEI